MDTCMETKHPTHMLKRLFLNHRLSLVRLPGGQGQQRSQQKSKGGSMYLRDTSGDLVAFTLMLMLLLIFLAVKAAIFVTSTFLKYYKKWILWASLLVSILLCVSGGLLVAFVNETFVLLI